MFSMAQLLSEGSLNMTRCKQKKLTWCCVKSTVYILSLHLLKYRTLGEAVACYWLCVYQTWSYSPQDLLVIEIHLL